MACLLFSLPFVYHLKVKNLTRRGASLHVLISFSPFFNYTHPENLEPLPVKL